MTEPVVTDTTTPTPTTEPKPTIEPVPAIEPQLTVESAPEVQSLPQPQIAANPISESAPTAIPAPKSGVLGGAEFAPGTAVLTTIGKRVVDRLAVSLQAYPSLSIEIGAHTDGVKGSAESLALTRNRCCAPSE